MRLNYTIRSDFADEVAQVNIQNETFSHVKKQYGSIDCSYIKVLEKENALGKEIGDYVSIQFENMFDHQSREEIIEVMDQQLHKMLDDMNVLPERTLIVGLGNRAITSDALGPEVVHEILVTAHFYEHEDKAMLHGTSNVAMVEPGVMGQTGLESFDVVKSIASHYNPNLIIAIDALATRNIQRINRVIQINNTGIQPGSGVGNHRMALNEESLHVPVIAIGVATVTSIGAILEEALVDKMEIKEEIFHNLHQKEHLDLVVTPKSMDDELEQLVYLLSEGLNRFLHPDYLNL